MVLHDDRTGRGYPLPHPDNLLEDDVQRLRDAIDGLDRDATALEERADVADAALVGKAAADLSNVPVAAFQAKAASVGLSLPTVAAGDSGKSLIVNPEGTGYQVGAAASSIQQTGPLYAPGGAGFSLTGKSVLAAYEQVAGQTFGLDYNTRASYAEQDGVNGTDAVGGAFALHNTAGAVIDANTKLLIHADGASGSTEIIDERGITPFGTHCAYFDGTARWVIPLSYKIAFGTAQNFTYECWVNADSLSSGAFILHVSSDTISQFAFFRNGTTIALYVNGASRITSSAITANTWQHLAYVRNAGTGTFYLNGVSQGTYADTYNYSPTTVSIGARNDGGSTPFSGWMDQFHISKVARYTSNFTPTTAEFAADADTVHLFQFNDGHGSQFIRDSAKSGHEIRNEATLSTGWAKFGSTSLRLANSNYAIVAATKPHADLALGALDFTLDLHARFDVSNVSQSLVHFGDGGQNIGLQLWLNGMTGNMEFYASSNGTSFNLANPVTMGTVVAGMAAHWAVSRVGTSIYLFKDGVLMNTVSVGTSAITGTGLVYLGRSQSNASLMTGYLDELRLTKRGVWNTGFTVPTVPYVTDDYTILLCHFEGANGDKVTLDSGESSYGTNGFGDTTTSALTFAGSAMLDAAYTRGGHGTSLKLNGSSQYASIQYATPSAGHPIYFSASDKFCIEGWFYQPTANVWSLFNIRGALSSEELFCQGSGSGTTWGFYDGGTRTVSGPAAVAGWNHIACVRDGRGYAVYVNGVSGSFANVANTPVAFSAAVTVWLGVYGGTSSWLNGAIDSFRITHGKPRYTANFTPGNLTQDDDTALLWVFDGAVGQKWVKELSKNTALIQSTNARTVRDGRYIIPPLTSFGPTVSTTNPKFGTGAVQNTGATNYCTIPNSSDWCPSGDFTFEVQVANLGTTGNSVILGKTNGTTETIVFYVRSDRLVVFNYIDTSGATISITSASAVGTSSSYSHIAVVRTAELLKLYINGVQNVSAVIATNGIRQDTAGSLTLFCNYNGTVYQNFLNGTADELRISNVARWTANFTPPTIPYGQQYVTGPFWVATKPGVSALDLTAFSSVAGVAFTGSTPPGTTITYLLSTDGYATPLRRWTGSAWVATAHSMSWNATAKSLATTATAAQLNAAGNSFAELQAGLRALDVSAVASLNVVAVLASNNPQFSPSLDAITLNMDEYQIMQPGADYTVRRKKANGVQTLEFKRLKPGNANHVVDYVG